MPRPSVPAIIQFGSGANPASEIGQFGSYPSPVYTSNIATLMSGTAWPRGWFGETVNTNRPFIQDFNAIDFVFCSYLFYLMTLGLTEYIAAMIYWTNSIVQVGGQIYISLQDNNQGNTPASSPTYWQAGLPGAELSGVVKVYAGVTSPSGYLLCNGAAVSRTTYAALFAVCGTNYGVGDGSTTFNIPDLRTRVPVGYMSGDTNFGTIGQTGGEETHILNIGEMPSHSHSIPIYSGGSFGQTIPSDGNFSELTTQQTNNAGGGGAHNNLQPYVTMNYIIKT